MQRNSTENVTWQGLLLLWFCLSCMPEMGRESQHVNRNVIYAAAAAESLVMLSTDAVHSQADEGKWDARDISLRGDSHILKTFHSAVSAVTLGQ